jgi:hypothetical protein
MNKILVVVFLLLLSGLAATLRPAMQAASNETAQARLARINQSTEQQLTIRNEPDSPLLLLSATVKEAAAGDFTALTGALTPFSLVSSVPEAMVQNVSGKTITSFAIGIRNDRTTEMRVLIKSGVRIPPGARFLLERREFIPSEKITRPNGASITVQPGLERATSWLRQGPRSELHAFIGQVKFTDRTSWLISH